MQYQSIIRLFEYCNINCKEMDRSKIKKILAAEFAVAERGIISIDGFDYSKNDVFLELENADFDKNLLFHEIIWKEKKFRQCLEHNTVELKYLQKWHSLSVNAEFVAFVSPYFAVAFDKIMKKFLDPINFYAANEWVKCLCFIDNAEDFDKAVQSVRMFFTDFIHSLKNVNEVTYTSITYELKAWIRQPSARFVNHFVDSMYDLTDDLVRAIINFTVVIQKVNIGMCYDLSCRLIQLSGIDSDLKDLIQSNHKIFKPAATKTYNSDSSDGNGYTGCIWLFLIMYFLFNVLRRL